MLFILAAVTYNNSIQFMKDEKYFKQIQQNIKPYTKVMAKAADIIQEQDVSSFPILVLSELPVNIGINIVEKEKLNAPWNINASTLEELVAKQVIAPEKVDDFKLVYKKSDPDLCLLLLTKEDANFVFVPRN
ncbi:MAG: hypothetical protein D6816_10345 [Bacteroidetes bacterium]|nr:MAG: hypothetical protein D6816_10345 [Bacteroidota bacterium]